MKVRWEGSPMVMEEVGKKYYLRARSDYKPDGSLVTPSRRGPILMISKRVRELAIEDGRLVE